MQNTVLGKSGPGGPKFSTLHSQPANGKITRIYFIYDVMFTSEHVLEEEVFVVVL